MQPKVLYVCSTGDDKASGQSWPEAKRTILAAYDALTLDGNGGDIYLADADGSGVDVSDDPSLGIWLMGKFDQNYDSLPAGWRRARSVRFIGMGVNTPLSNASHQGVAHCLINGPDWELGLPVIWLSGNGGEAPIHFANIGIKHCSKGIVIGTSSSGKEATLYANTSFRNCGVQVRQTLGCGPAVSINGGVSAHVEGTPRGYTFWVYFEGCGFFGNMKEPVDSMKHRAMWIEQAYLVFLRDVLFTHCGCTYIPPSSSGWSFFAEHIQLESSTYAESPAIEIRNGGGPGVAHIYDVETFDGPNAGVVIDPSISASQIVYASCVAPVSGPATIIGGFFDQYPVIPLSFQKQIGIARGRIFAASPAVQRAFSPVAVRIENIASHDPARWVPEKSHGCYPSGGVAKVTRGAQAPDGTENAAILSYTDEALGQGAVGIVEIARSDIALEIGDHIIVGAWACVNATPSIISIGLRLITNGNCSPTGAEAFRCSGDLTGSSDNDPNFRGAGFGINFLYDQCRGLWEFQSGIVRIVSTGPNPCRIVLSASIRNGGAGLLFGPILLHASASRFSGYEAAEMAQNLLTYSDGPGVGDCAVLRGQRLVFAPDRAANIYRPATDTLRTDGSFEVARRLSSRVLSRGATEIKFTSKGPIEFDCQTGDIQCVCLSADVTEARIINAVIGQQLTIEWVQDETGSRKYVWPGEMKFANGAAPKPSTRAKSRDSITFRYDGRSWIEMARALNIG